MKTDVLIAALMIAALAACSPTVTVKNGANFPVHTMVTGQRGTQMLSPTPGESSTAEMDLGAYTVVVIPDADWLDYAKGVRKYLNDQLANADNLTGPQLLEVVQRLKDIALRMQQLEKAGTAGGTACSGTLTSEKSDAVATISLTAAGGLAITCK